MRFFIKMRASARYQDPLNIPPKRNDTHNYYTILKAMVIKPDNISDLRFDKLLQINATILNLFINNRTLVNQALDGLEMKIAKTIAKSGKSFRVQTPTSFLEFNGRRYAPEITKESLEGEYNPEFLTQPLLEQLAKHGINTNTAFIFDLYEQVEANKNQPQKDILRSFFHTNPKLVSFFGFIEFQYAKRFLENGFIFSEPLDYPDTDSRFHGSFTHLIQQYVLSILFEAGKLGDLCVEGETPITLLDILNSDTFSVRFLKEDGTIIYHPDDCLFDLKWEEGEPSGKKMRLLQSTLDPKAPSIHVLNAPNLALHDRGLPIMAEAFNISLMLNRRFPSLSTILYIQFARESEKYFSLFVSNPENSRQGLEFQIGMKEKSSETDLILTRVSHLAHAA